MNRRMMTALARREDDRDVVSDVLSKVM